MKRPLATVSSAELGYFVLRLGLGVNIAMHGYTRISAGPGMFATSLDKQFAHSALHGWPVHAFGLALPFLEASIGTLVLLGLMTREALLAGGLLMTVLTFGVTLNQQWDIAGLQLTYVIAFALLLFLESYNALSLDRLPFTRGHRPTPESQF